MHLLAGDAEISPEQRATLSPEERNWKKTCVIIKKFLNSEPGLFLNPEEMETVKLYDEADKKGDFTEFNNFVRKKY